MFDLVVIPHNIDKENLKHIWYFKTTTKLKNVVTNLRFTPLRDTNKFNLSQLLFALTDVQKPCLGCLTLLLMTSHN